MPCLALSVSPIVHGGVEPFPRTLGALHDQFERRGAPFITLLADPGTLPVGSVRTDRIRTHLAGA
jgi:hypothetical protein